MALLEAEQDDNEEGDDDLNPEEWEIQDGSDNGSVNEEDFPIMDESEEDEVIIAEEVTEKKKPESPLPEKTPESPTPEKALPKSMKGLSIASDEDTEQVAGEGLALAAEDDSDDEDWGVLLFSFHCHFCSDLISSLPHLALEKEKGQEGKKEGQGWIRGELIKLRWGEAVC